MSKKFWEAAPEDEENDMTLQEAEGLMALTDHASVTVEKDTLGLAFLLGSVYALSMMAEAEREGKTFNPFAGGNSIKEMEVMMTTLMESEGFARAATQLTRDELLALGKGHGEKVAETHRVITDLAQRMPNGADALTIAMGKTIRDKITYLRDLTVKFEDGAFDEDA